MALNEQSGTINLSLVQELITNYREHQLVSIVESTTSPMKFDAHSAWFDLEVLKNFIADIEQQASDYDPETKSILGIRFYYAAYPESAKWGTPGYEDLALNTNGPLPEAYEKLHTLVMIPTKEIDGVATDFNLLDIGTALIPNTIMALNHGHLAPPESEKGESF